MITLLTGDCRDQLSTLPDRSVQCIVTSPPYYGLRKYTDDPKEIGQEPTPAAYVAALVAVFAACWRVLRDDGVLWLNLGDSYSGSWGNYGGQNRGHGTQRAITNGSMVDQKAYAELEAWRPPTAGDTGLAPKNLLGIPWRVAFALQDAGWILRSDIIWSKPNPMPESVRDRPTRSHEYLFLFAKKPRYYYDATAIAEPIKRCSIDRINQPSFDDQTGGAKDYGATGINPSRSMRKALEHFKDSASSGTRNKRSVWTIATRPYAGAHFATMPEALIAPCILAGSSAQACESCGAAWGRVVERTDEIATTHNGSRFDVGKTSLNGQKNVQKGDRYTTVDRGVAPACRCAVNTGAARSIVLDPFGGSGTVAKVAERYQRDSILIDLNPAYVELQEERTNGVQVEMQLL